MFIISSFIALSFFLAALHSTTTRLVGFDADTNRAPSSLPSSILFEKSIETTLRARTHTGKKKKKKIGDESSSLQLPETRIDPRWQNAQKDRQFPMIPTWRISKPNEPSTSIICSLVIGFVRASSRWKLARNKLIAGTFRFCRISRGWQVRVECKSSCMKNMAPDLPRRWNVSSVFDVFDATVSNKTTVSTVDSLIRQCCMLLNSTGMRIRAREEKLSDSVQSESTLSPFQNRRYYRWNETCSQRVDSKLKLISIYSKYTNAFLFSEFLQDRREKLWKLTPCLVTLFVGPQNAPLVSISTVHHVKRRDI